MNLNDVGDDEAAEERILNEVIDMLGARMGSRVGPKVLDLEVSTGGPKGEVVNEGEESAIENLMNKNPEMRDEPSDEKSDLDVPSLEQELEDKGIQNIANDDEDEATLRSRGKIF